MNRKELSRHIAALLTDELSAPTEDSISRYLSVALPKALVKRETTARIIATLLLEYAVDALDKRAVADLMARRSPVAVVHYVGAWSDFTWLCPTTMTWM